MSSAQRTAQGAAEIEAYRDRIADYLTTLASHLRIPGIAVELIAGDRHLSICTGTLGCKSALPMTRDARFKLGSIVRIMYASVLLEQAVSGKLDLHSPVEQWISELKDSPVGRDVLLWHLLSHAAGYQSIDLSDPKVRSTFTWAQLMTELRSACLLFTPGTVFSHAQPSVALLEQIVSRSEGRPAREVVEDRIAGKLGLRLGNAACDVREAEHRVVSHVHDVSNRVPIECPDWQLSELWRMAMPDLTISVADLTRLLAAIMQSRSDAGLGALLSPAAAELLQRQTLAVPYTSGSARSERLPLTVGPGCWQYRRDWIGASGPLFGQSLIFRYHCSRPLAVVVGLNVHLPFAAELIAEEVIASLTGEPRQLSETPPKSDLEVSELVGDYIGCVGYKVSVSSEDGDLSCRISFGDHRRALRVRLVSSGDGQWKVASEAGPLALGFFRDASTPCLMIGATAYRKLQ